MFVFLLLVLILVMLTHGFVWWRLATAFSLDSTGRLVLLLALLLLISTVVLFSVLAHRGDGSVVRWGYIISYLWMGFLTQIFFWLLVTWPLEAGMTVMGIERSPLLVVATCLLLSVSGTAWGIYQAAYGWRTVRQEIGVVQLPKNLDDYRIAHLSDLHVGIVNRTDFMERVVNETLATGPNLVVITGDVLDGTGHGHEVSLRPLERLAAAVPTVAILGNHDTYFGIAQSTAELERLGVVVLRDQAMNIDGLNVIGADYPTDHRRRDLTRLLNETVTPSAVNVLLNHEPVGMAQAAAHGVGLQLSGHTHQGQVWPFGLMTRLAYGGYDRGTHQFGDMTLVVSPGLGSWGPYVKSSAPPTVNLITLRRIE